MTGDLSGRALQLLTLALASGLALPIGDWPVGNYRVEVDIRDRTSGARTSTRGFFTVAN